MSYEDKIKREIEIYKNQVNVHELPGIFHYWSHNYVRPMLEEFGIANSDDLYLQYSKKSLECSDSNYILGIGSGNCETEIRLAKTLKELGYVDIKVECVEINPFMIERAKELAIAGNVAENMIFMEADFNNLKLDRKYAAVIAHQSLHHVVELENLFDVVKTNIDPNGYFITSDMVGRNGHMRWPKALAVVNELWESLEPNYKYNHMQGRQEEIFINHDCSNEGFEGVRAQDIVPLLLNRFNFELFIGFGNIIFPFVDRCFGHNFEPDNLSDKQFIDKVHRIDENLMVSGQINPTQMLAALKVNEVNSVKFSRGISPFNYI